MEPSFRQFWAYEEEKAKNHIDHVLDDPNLIMYFKKGKEVFGTGEDGRVVFAKLKHPDEDMPSGWEEDASFSAINLGKAVQGAPSQHVFTYKDLKGIKIIDRDKAYKILEKMDIKPQSAKTPFVINLSKMFNKDPDDAPNFIQAKEKS